MVRLCIDSFGAEVGTEFVLDAVSDQETIKPFFAVREPPLTVVPQIFVVEEIVIGTENAFRPLELFQFLIILGGCIDFLILRVVEVFGATHALREVVALVKTPHAFVHLVLEFASLL